MINILSALALIAVVGIVCQWIAWRAKLPAILFLLLAGIALGPVAGVVNADAIFGDLLFPFISLSVAVILFEGSLTLKFKELKDIGSVVTNMVSYGALVNAFITTIAVHFLTGLSWPLAALFGAIMVVTGPTVIMPLLRTVRPNKNVSKVLRWEGIVIDPLGALFAVLIFEWIIAQQTGEGWGHISLIFFSTIMTGIIIGAMFGYVFGVFLRNHAIPEYLHNFATLAIVAGTFSLSEAFYHESGLLAVTILGIWLANMRGVDTDAILDFKENLTLVLVSTLFIVLAARIDFGAFTELGWGGLGVLLVMQFISRPIKVLFCTYKSVFTWNEKALIAWVGPRGIVAAAVTALFALKLESLGYESAELLVPLAFAVIMGTVIIQSATARPLAKALGVAEPNSNGYLIVGANPVAREIASALDGVGLRVVMADTSWENISAARMKNLPTYYGNVLSEHADNYLELVGIGGLLGLSHYSDRNNLAANRYRNDFGIGNVLCLATKAEKSTSNKHSTSEKHSGRTLFSKEMTYSKLASMIAKGGQIKNTTLSEEFDYTAWRGHENNQNSFPLFAIDGKGKVNWFTEEAEMEPKTGWQLFSLVPKTESENGK